MRDAKKARPDAPTPGQANVGNDFAGHAPTSQFTTQSVTSQRKIADFLCTGAAAAVPLRELVRLTGLGERDVRKRIEAERRAGALILADNHSGYFLAANAADALRFVRSMRGRAREIQKTAAAIEKAVGE